MRTGNSIFAVALLISIAASGCSWIYNFNIINRSKETVTISYKLTATQGIFLESPVISRNGTPGPEIPIIVQDSTVQFDLRPGEQATIAKGMNTSLKNSSKKSGYYAGNINFKWLKIRTKNATLEYTPDNVEKGLTTNKIALSEIERK
jgi:hypothetical protein